MIHKFMYHNIPLLSNPGRAIQDTTVYENMHLYIYIKLSFRVHSKSRQHKSQAKLYIGLFISQAHLEGDLDSYLEKSQRMLPSENPVKTSTSPAQLNKHMYWVRLKVTRLDERCKLVSFHGSQK